VHGAHLRAQNKPDADNMVSQKTLELEQVSYLEREFEELSQKVNTVIDDEELVCLDSDSVLAPASESGLATSR
jgi:hypothetical protein